MTRIEATKIAGRIVNFWSQIGCRVHAWVEKEPYVEGVNEVGFTVRTDMIAGYPRNITPHQRNELAARSRA